MQWYFWVLLIAAIVIMLFILFAFIFSYVAFRMAFYSSPKEKEDPHGIPKGEQFDERKEEMFAMIDEMDAIPYERVYTKSYDGLKLSARYYRVKDGAPLQIQVHGWRGMGVRDFSGGCKFAIDSGYNVLLIDQRCAGESGGKVITFGIREKYDVLSWIAYSLNRFGAETQICLTGISMGAATVLETAAFDLPKNVKAIIADSPFSSPEEILASVSAGMGMNPKFVMPFIKMGAYLYGGLKIEGGAEEAVKNCKIPVLILHGEDDRFVPTEMGRRIYAACASDKRLFTVPGAGHGLSFIIDREGYEKTVTGFLLGVFGDKNG
ncbi:MAG: alpha/beta hydrolase [Clostridia bacterium]|nr:alpha/beta hydrolase [Clostridia bacterium]